jgi:hypothetical protein
MNAPLHLTVLGTGYLGTTHAACMAGLARRNIVDGRSVLDPARWRAAGWNYRALGMALNPPHSTRSAERQGTEGREHSGSR